MSVEMAYLISFVFGIFGLAGTVYGITRNHKHDIKQDTKETASVAYELKALQDSLAEFKAEIRLSMKSNSDMALDNHDKIIKLESEMKTAFIRIDELKAAVSAITTARNTRI